MIPFYAAAITYVAAINLYAITMLRRQKNRDGEKHTGDGKILLAAVLGGAAGVYVAMFVMRYRLENLGFMVLMPVLAVLEACVFFVILRRLPLLLAAA